MSNPQLSVGEEVIPTEASPTQINRVEQALSDTPVDEANDLILAAFTIFEEGKNECILPTSGLPLVVKSAKMGQLAALMKFFRTAASSLSEGELNTVVNKVVDKQKEAIARGVHPDQISLKDLADDEDMISAAFGNASIILTIFEAMFEHLPELASQFTNLSPTQYEELEFDEGVLVILGIFILNYSFFTQRLLPMLMGFIKSLASESLKAQRAQARANEKTRSR